MHAFATDDAVRRVDGLILAGGRGSRMGGADKGLLAYQGEPLAAHLLRRLAPQVASVRINANRHREAYTALGCEVVADPSEFGAYPGPLAGMLSGLRASTRDWLCCVPCDSPLLPADYVARLAAAQATVDADVAMAVCDGPQPVFALLRVALRDDLAAFLAAGERKIDRWFARHRWVEVDFANRPEAFLNLNAPEDWAALERSVGPSP